MNGLQDLQETGKPHQRIDLFCIYGDEKDLGHDEETNVSTISGIDGIYSFDNVQSGECSIQVAQLPGSHYDFSPIREGGNQVNEKGISAFVEVKGGDLITSLNVGMYLQPGY